MDRQKKERVRQQKIRRRLPELMREYVESCRPPEGADPKKGGGRLPTLAGFCGYIGCGLSELETLAVEAPEIWEQLSAILEDEVLNHTPSPTLLLAYLKKRLHYAEEPEAHAEAPGGRIQLLFEHNIEEDGG